MARERTHHHRRSRFGDLDTLFYDTTNFFTNIASTNSRPKLTQRGNSKQKRGDLRLFSLALLVSRDGQIPLSSQVYEDNKVDASCFPIASAEDATAFFRQIAPDRPSFVYTDASA